MNTVDKPLSQSKIVSGVVALLCVIGLLLATLCALVTAEKQLDSMTAQAMELGQQVEEQAQIILAQDELLDAYREHHAALAGILGQAADTLHAIAYGPYSREEVQELIADVADVIQEVNQILTFEEAEEISQAIVTNALAANMDPYLLLSVAITESHCRPLARGRSGEYGMLQVMPSTGAWIAGRLGYRGYEPAQLLDIRANVQYATYYLKISIREFDGDAPKGVLAYNRGSSGAKRWMKDNTPEDHRYVRKVMGTYQKLKGV